MQGFILTSGMRALRSGISALQNYLPTIPLHIFSFSSTPILHPSISMFLLPITILTSISMLLLPISVLHIHATFHYVSPHSPCAPFSHTVQPLPLHAINQLFPSTCSRPLLPPSFSCVAPSYAPLASPIHNTNTYDLLLPSRALHPPTLLLLPPLLPPSITSSHHSPSLHSMPQTPAHYSLHMHLPPHRSTLPMQHPHLCGPPLVCFLSRFIYMLQYFMNPFLLGSVLAIACILFPYTLRT